MKGTVKTIALAWLSVGLITVASLSFSESDSESAAQYADCPAFATQGALFMGNTSKHWAEAAQMSAQLAAKTAPEAIALDLPRNNFIDDYLFDKMKADGIPNANLCTDEEFVRRVYLDLTGRIPSSAAVRDFLSGGNNNNGNKRADLINSLLGSDEYVNRWTMWFGDLLRNTYSLLYYGRTPYYNYIRDFVQNNRPYDQVATELLTASGYSWDPKNGPVNFLARSWEPMVNRLDVLDNTAVQAGRVFLGVPILCISCHNGAGHLNQVNLYLTSRARKDLWGLSAFFSGLTYQRTRESQNPNLYSYTFNVVPTRGYNRTGSGSQGGIRPDRFVPAGEDPVVPPNYFFTGEQPAKGGEFRAEFARLMTADRQFAKATVNYLWKELMGMGIVDPPDAFDLARQDPKNPPPDPWTIQPTHPELLEALADEFQASGFDIRHMIQLITSSTAYQLSAAFPGNWEGRYAQYFARHFAKRMTAEMVLDSVFSATGLPGAYDIQDVGQVNWTMMLPDPTEPRAGGGENVATRGFLNIFLRGNRDTSVREPAGSILQALALMNNPLVVNRVRANGGGLVTTLSKDKNMSNDQIVDELFLATLSRYPNDQERAQALSLLDRGRDIGAESLQLVLVNKLDFMFY